MGPWMWSVRLKVQFRKVDSIAKLLCRAALNVGSYQLCVAVFIVLSLCFSIKNNNKWRRVSYDMKALLTHGCGTSENKGARTEPRPAVCCLIFLNSFTFQNNTKAQQLSVCQPEFTQWVSKGLQMKCVGNKVYLRAGGVCGSVTEWVHSMETALGSIPSTKTRNFNEFYCKYLVK